MTTFFARLLSRPCVLCVKERHLRTVIGSGAGFASLFDEATDDGSSALKRKRWHAERDVALGLFAESSSQ